MITKWCGMFYEPLHPQYNDGKAFTNQADHTHSRTPKGMVQAVPARASMSIEVCTIATTEQEGIRFKNTCNWKFMGSSDLDVKLTLLTHEYY